jgi:hypothetical protein
MPVAVSSFITQHSSLVSSSHPPLVVYHVLHALAVACHLLTSLLLTCLAQRGVTRLLQMPPAVMPAAVMPVGGQVSSFRIHHSGLITVVHLVSHWQLSLEESAQPHYSYPPLVVYFLISYRRSAEGGADYLAQCGVPGVGPVTTKLKSEDRSP